MARTAAEKERQFCFRKKNFSRALFEELFAEDNRGTEAPKEFLDKFTIEEFEPSFIEVSAIISSKKYIKMTQFV